MIQSAGSMGIGTYVDIPANCKEDKLAELDIALRLLAKFSTLGILLKTFDIIDNAIKISTSTIRCVVSYKGRTA